MSVSDLASEIDSVADGMEDALSDIRPALRWIEMNAGAGGKATAIIRDRLNDLAESAAWLRKFAREDEQYEPDPPQPRDAAEGGAS